MKGSAQSISWTPHTANTAGTDTELMVVQYTPQEDETVDEEVLQTTDCVVTVEKEGEVDYTRANIICRTSFFSTGWRRDRSDRCCIPG